MTRDELNSLKSLKATLGNAFAQTDLFWAREIMASGMMSLDAMIVRGEKQHKELDTTGMRPCPICNPTGVFKYSPLKGCDCDGKAWIDCDA